ncbi:golgin candidate protein [Acrasis kona]|uniref:Golgin candidate protein n=1 Tax=Acrasis kona TaxID=1008807 RepID=A0AAW2YP16_9EUKA
MSWLFNIVAPQAQEEIGSRVNVREVIETLRTSSLYEDRIEALGQLIEISAKEAHQRDFGSEGFQYLIKTLNSERDDLEMQKMLLEIILNLALSKTTGDTYLSVIVQSHIPTFLGLLSEQDAYVKYHSIQLLTELLKHDPTKVQNSILSENGVGRLVAMLDEKEEVIRNEGLLLLKTLAQKGAPETKKIIAFQGAFEKLFHVMTEDTNIRDCTETIYHLLLDNESNQRHLLVVNAATNLQFLLELNPNVTDMTSPLAQTTSLALDIIIILLLASKTNEFREQFTVNSLVMHRVVILALDTNPLVEIANKALFALGMICYHYRPAQECIESATFQKQDTPESALVRLVRMVLFDHIESRRQISFDCLKKFLHNNEEGQLLIASTVKAPQLVTSSAEQSMLCGITLSEALFSFDKPKHHMHESFHACIVLSGVIRYNIKCRNILLEIPYEIRGGKPVATFYECLIKSLIKNLRKEDYLVIGLLRLLCIWVYKSPESASRWMVSHHSEFLSLLELVISNEQGLIHTQSLSCLLVCLLGMEFQHDEDSNTFSHTKESITDMILNRIGLDRIKNIYSQLTGSDRWLKITQRIVQVPDLLDRMPNDVVPFHIYDETFIEFCQIAFEHVIDYYYNYQSNPQQQEQHSNHHSQPVNNNNNNITKQQEELLLQELQELKTQHESLLKHNQELEDKLTNINIDFSKLKITNTQQQVTKESLTNQITRLESELSISQGEFEKDRRELLNRVQIAETTAHNIESQTSIKLQEYESLVAAYDQLEQEGSNKDVEINMLKQSVKNFENQIKTTVSNQNVQLENDLKLSENKLREVIQELQNKETEMNRLNMHLVNVGNDFQNAAVVNQQKTLECESLQARVKELEELIAGKDQRIIDMEKDNDDMMDIIEKLETELAKREQ